MDDSTINALQFLTTILQNMGNADELPCSANIAPIPPTSSHPDPTYPPVPTLPAMLTFNVTSDKPFPPQSEPTISHAELPRVQLQHKLNAVCQQNTKNRLSKKSQALIVNKLMNIYDSTTGKKLTLQVLLQNPLTTDTWSKSASNEYG